MTTETTYADLDQVNGSYIPFQTPRYLKSSGGAVTITPNWEYYEFCGTGGQISFELSHFDENGSGIVSYPLVWNHGEQGVTKAFKGPDPTGQGSTHMPGGGFRLIGKTSRSGCGGVEHPVHPNYLRVDMTITWDN